MQSSFFYPTTKKINKTRTTNVSEVPQFTALFDSSHLFNKKDTSKDASPRKACGSPFATNELYICMITADILAFSFSFGMVLTYCAETDLCLTVRGLLSLSGVFL